MPKKIITIIRSMARAHSRQGVAVLFILALGALVFPQEILATQPSSALYFPANEANKASILYIGYNPDRAFAKARRSTYIVVTSYNSVPWQTDNTPFITASGTPVRDGVIASNYLPIGTLVRFPDLFGSKVFVVEDRMNARYHKRADIWSDDFEFSKQFGARYLKMEIL